MAQNKTALLIAGQEGDVQKRLEVWTSKLCTQFIQSCVVLFRSSLASRRVPVVVGRNKRNQAGIFCDTC